MTRSGSRTDVGNLGKILFEDKSDNKSDNYTAGTDVADGMLRFNAISGADGSGKGSVIVAYSNGGKRDTFTRTVDGVQTTVTEYRVHAGDEDVYLIFTYEADQTIQKWSTEIYHSLRLERAST